MSKMTFATEAEATKHGAAIGCDDGAALYNENHADYRSESHAVSGLGECASEAAGVLGVPREFCAAWISAYEAAARETILRLYGADND